MEPENLIEFSYDGNPDTAADYIPRFDYELPKPKFFNTETEKFLIYLSALVLGIYVYNGTGLY
jgi:hypothetical protein